MCGCGKKGLGVINQGGAKTFTSPRVIHQSGASAAAAATPRTTPKGGGGAHAQVQKRCTKCSWPMNSMRKFDQQQNKQVQIWACMNRKCLHREET